MNNVDQWLKEQEKNYPFRRIKTIQIRSILNGWLNCWGIKILKNIKIWIGVGKNFFSFLQDLQTQKQ